MCVSIFNAPLPCAAHRSVPLKSRRWCTPSGSNNTKLHPLTSKVSFIALHNSAPLRFTTMIHSRFPRLVMTLISSLSLSRAHDVTHRSPLRSRKLERQTRRLEKSSTSVVSTSECENVRTKPFAAKLELEYLYLVESLVPLQNLQGVQNVNNRAILDALVTCDDKGFPLYGLDLGTPHEDVEQGKSLIGEFFELESFLPSFPLTSSQCRVLHSPESRKCLFCHSGTRVHLLGWGDYRRPRSSLHGSR